MKYNQKFATGKSTIDIDEKWASILTELDRQEKCNNHTETRRHESYTNGNDDAEWLAVDDKNIKLLNYGMSYHDELLKELPNAIEKLKPAQKAIIIAIYFQGMTQKEYAKQLGIDQSCVSRRLSTAEKNLKKIFEKTA